MRIPTYDQSDRGGHSGECAAEGRGLVGEGVFSYRLCRDYAWQSLLFQPSIRNPLRGAPRIKMILLLVSVSGGILLCLAVRNWWQNRRNWHLLNQLPGPKPWPLLGNVPELGIFSKLINPMTAFLQVRLILSNIYKNEKLFRLWIGGKAIIFLIAPETVETVLSSNSSLEKGVIYKFASPWLGEGLVSSDGGKWRQHRKMLMPTFHFRILEDFLDVMNEQASVLVQKLDQASRQRPWLDILHFASLCTLDIICETAMGCSIGAQHKESLYGEAIKKAARFIMSRGLKPWVYKDWLYYLTREGKEFKEAVATLHHFTYQVIADKMNAKNKSVGNADLGDDVDVKVKKRIAFLDLLLDSDFTREEVREEVDTFMFAGHETISSALSWLVYVLGLHPEVQERVVQEMEKLFSGDKERHVTQDDLRQLKYLDCVIKETMRIFPPVPGVSRKLAEDTRIGGYLVPKGTECSVAVYLLHHNADVYPDPEVFDPDRFLPENSAGRHPFAFVPFSAGPRNCIGQRFAQMELRVIICHLLRHFRVRSLDPRDRVVLVPEITLRTDKPLRIEVLPR